MKDRKNIAIIYDFDYTLSVDNSPVFGLFPLYQISGNDFWEHIEVSKAKIGMEAILGYLYYLKKMAEEKGKPLTKKILNDSGKDIKFFPGVESWFERINKFGKKNGVKVEHYLISSGIKEILEGCSIAKHFTKIFASSYHYDEKGQIDWPLVAINYTNKMQFIHRINKGILNISDDSKVNGYMPKDERPVPYERMVYIGDGYTDVPCMKLIKSKGGCAVAVYSQGKDETAKKMLETQRSSFSLLADYTEGSELDIKIKDFISNA